MGRCSSCGQVTREIMATAGAGAHLREGRYLVLDDVALEQYKRDPRVVFVPGSPIGNELMPAIMPGLGVELPGQSVQKMLQAWAALRARWRYR